MTFKKGNIEKMIYMNNQIHTDSLFKQIDQSHIRLLTVTQSLE